jgi:hypothetical protein
MLIIVLLILLFEILLLALRIVLRLVILILLFLGILGLLLEHILPSVYFMVLLSFLLFGIGKSFLLRLVEPNIVRILLNLLQVVQFIVLFLLLKHLLFEFRCPHLPSHCILLVHHCLLGLEFEVEFLN